MMLVIIKEDMGVIKCFNPEMAGLWAVYYGLELAWGKGYKNVLLETDDDEIYHQIMIPVPGYQFWHLVGVIRQLMDEEWDDLQLDAIPGSTNAASARFTEFCIDEDLGPGEFEDLHPMVRLVVGEDKILE